MRSYPTVEHLYKFFSIYQSEYYWSSSDCINLLGCCFAYFCSDQKTILELGVGNGSFLYALANGTKAPNAIGVDNFMAPNQFPAHTFVLKAYKNLDSILENQSNILLINDNTKNLLQHAFSKNTLFSLIHIDADHGEESVIADAINSSSMLSKNGILIFDDIDLQTVNTAVNTWLQATTEYSKVLCLKQKLYVCRTNQLSYWRQVFTLFFESLCLNYDLNENYLFSNQEHSNIYLGDSPADNFESMYKKWEHTFSFISNPLFKDSIKPNL